MQYASFVCLCNTQAWWWLATFITLRRAVKDYKERLKRPAKNVQSRRQTKKEEMIRLEVLRRQSGRAGGRARAGPIPKDSATLSLYYPCPLVGLRSTSSRRLTRLEKEWRKGWMTISQTSLVPFNGLSTDHIHCYKFHFIGKMTPLLLCKIGLLSS